MQAIAVNDAEKAEVPVKHPLLDKVRKCSAYPDLAADFFCLIFHPDACLRSSHNICAQEYIIPSLLQMRAYRAAHPGEPSTVIHLCHA